MSRNRRILLAIAVIFAVYAVVSSPNESADTVHGAFGMVGEGISGIFRFFDALLSR